MCLYGGCDLSVVVGITPPLIMVEGSNIRLYAHRPMVSLIQPTGDPSIQPADSPLPQIRDLELGVYVGAVEQVCCPELHSGDRCLSSSILFKYISSRWHLFVLSWPGHDGLLWGVLFRSDVR